MHEGPDGCLPTRLQASVIRRIQIRNPPPAHHRFDNGRCGHTRHAGKRVDIDHAVVAFFYKLQNRGNAQAGLGGDIKRKNIGLFEQLFQVAYLVIMFNINQSADPSVELLLSHFLVEKISAKTENVVYVVS